MGRGLDAAFPYGLVLALSRERKEHNNVCFFQLFVPGTVENLRGGILMFHLLGLSLYLSQTFGRPLWLVEAPNSGVFPNYAYFASVVHAPCLELWEFLLCTCFLPVICHHRLLSVRWEWIFI